MPLLTDSEFLLHQAYLGSGYAGLGQLNASLQSGVNLIVDSVDIDVELDMLYFYNQNLSNVNATTSTYGLLRLATEALQRHVTSRTGQTFNDYLFFRGLKVTSSFADLSKLLGVEINAGNIQ